MRIPETATLVAETYLVDECGVERSSETEKPVYGYYDSVTASEVFEGGRNGLNPSFRFCITELDYDGQQTLVRDGEKYSIYRTYKPNNGTIELYCERKGGV